MTHSFPTPRSSGLVADAALQPQDVPTNGDAGTGARADEKLTDDLNDILQPFHWEAWKAALFSDHPDGWPDDDEQDAICQRVDSMVGGRDRKSTRLNSSH